MDYGVIIMKYSSSKASIWYTHLEKIAIKTAFIARERSLNLTRKNGG